MLFGNRWTRLIQCASGSRWTVSTKGKKDGRFEVIIGKSMTAEGESKCFGLVNSYDTKPKRRVFEVLKSQGMQMNQQITFLSDGGDTVRELQLYLNPQAEHLLDWFHVVRQEATGVIVRHGARHDRTWCSITSTLGGEARR